MKEHTGASRKEHNPFQCIISFKVKTWSKVAGNAFGRARSKPPCTNTIFRKLPIPHSTTHSTHTGREVQTQIHGGSKISGCGRRSSNCAQNAQSQSKGHGQHETRARPQCQSRMLLLLLLRRSVWGGLCQDFFEGVVTSHAVFLCEDI